MNLFWRRYACLLPFLSWQVFVVCSPLCRPLCFCQNQSILTYDRLCQTTITFLIIYLANWGSRHSQQFFRLWIIEQGWTFSITMLDFEVSETVIDNFCASSIVIACYVLFPIMIWTNFLWRETHVWARGTSCIIWKSCRLKNAHLWIIELRSLWFESCSKLYDKWWAGCGTIWNNFINKFSPEKPLALITMLQVVKNSEFSCFRSSRKLLAKVRKLLWSPWSIEKGLQLYRNVFLPFLLYLKH